MNDDHTCSRERRPSSPISPVWWPALALAIPPAAPFLLAGLWRLRRNRARARRFNLERLRGIRPAVLPELGSMAITVVVEQAREPGVLGDAAVSYLVRTDEGSLLMDLGFGAERRALASNMERLDLDLTQVDALVISHLHPDHMGGVLARLQGHIRLPAELAVGYDKPCYVPVPCRFGHGQAQVVLRPMLLEAGLATTGPLASAQFFDGILEEQVLIGRLSGRGLVVVIGCGHPGIELALNAARRVCNESVYAVVGGLHLPMSSSRSRPLGLDIQRLAGAGAPPWQPPGAQDLDRTIRALNEAAPHASTCQPTTAATKPCIV